MKGDDDILVLLNRLLTVELSSINQHYVHAKMCAHWGFSALASRHRGASMHEMKHADRLIARVLFLEGVPNLQRYDALSIGEDPREQLTSDLARELQVVADYNAGVARCAQALDHGSRELLEELLVVHEEHVDWLETQLRLIACVGEPRYLSEQT